jgi:hypothetical protein
MSNYPVTERQMEIRIFILCNARRDHTLLAAFMVFSREMCEFTGLEEENQAAAEEKYYLLAFESTVKHLK